MAELTPMMKQYMETKSQYQDCILFYRLGDFYEMFFEDALTASRELEITLTGKNCGQEERAPMCGVPYHAVEGYLNRLVAKGYYDYVTGKFDKLLAEHGYVREGHYYRVEKPNEDTLVFFCHFGLECVLLAHLIGASPMVLWHGFCAAPSSVTTVNTEERREGIASFRISAFGDISHLYVHDEPPAFAARFCEMYSNTDERHD